MEIRKVNWFFPVFIIGYFVLSILCSSVMLGLMNSGINVPDWIQYVLSEGIVLIIAIIYMIINRIDPFTDLGYRKIGFTDAVLSLVAGYCMRPMVLFISNISMFFSTNYLEEGTNTLLTYPFLMQVILMAVIPPLVEELVFRGIFFGTYRKAGLCGAAIMSGLIFACFHLNINQALYAFAIGIVFAYMVEATGSLWSSVIAHFAINTYSIGVIEILKLAGMYTADGEMAGALAESGSAQAETSLVANIVALVFMAALAAGFMMISVLCIRAMAKRHGRSLTLRCDNESVKNYLSLPVVIGLVMCIAYMILIEVVV